jgi:hypothetical protein
VVVGGDIDGRIRGFGQLIEDGDGNVNYGTCIGGFGVMCTNPDKGKL